MTAQEWLEATASCAIEQATATQQPLPPLQPQSLQTDQPQPQPTIKQEPERPLKRARIDSDDDLSGSTCSSSIDDEAAEDLEPYSHLRPSPARVHQKATFYAKMADEAESDSEINRDQRSNVEIFARIRKALVLGIDGPDRGDASSARIERAFTEAYQLMISSKMDRCEHGLARRVSFFHAEKHCLYKKFPNGDWHGVLSKLVAKIFNVKQYRSKSRMGYIFFGPGNEVDIAALGFEMAVNKMVWLSREELDVQDIDYMLDLAKRADGAISEIIETSAAVRKVHKKAKEHANEICDRVMSSMKQKRRLDPKKK
jgi:hypothetical protein